MLRREKVSWVSSCCHWYKMTEPSPSSHSWSSARHSLLSYMLPRGANETPKQEFLKIMLQCPCYIRSPFCLGSSTDLCLSNAHPLPQKTDKYNYLPSSTLWHDSQSIIVILVSKDTPALYSSSIIILFTYRQQHQ